MNRTQKKCFLASTGFHLLLLLLLFIGPAFLTSQDKEAENRPLLDFVPIKTIDEALSGGGNPNARPPAPTPTPPAPEPKPPQAQEQQIRQPDPPKPPPRDSEQFDITPKKKLPDVSTNKIVRSTGTSTKQRQPSKPNSPADDARTQVAKAALGAANNLRQSFSSSTTVEMPGPGGGGVPYANFLDGVRKRYSDAWVVPDGVTDDEATATASVTISRDGTVLSARIIRESGNALADQSVEAVLRRVKFAVPLPENAKENQRTVTIIFNVKAKRGLG
jgi:TonB family protein